MVVVFRATIHHREASPMAQTISVLGIDIAKLVFHVVGMDDSGGPQKLYARSGMHCVVM
jgi:hypothetical protein